MPSANGMAIVAENHQAGHGVHVRRVGNLSSFLIFLSHVCVGRWQTRAISERQVANLTYD